MGSFAAAGTAYATHGEPMIPFYIFYSMFGYQRIGDLVWAFGDARGRGFLLGATAGRTTLNGEGLQHQDGHSPLLFSAVPNCEVYDPAYAYEVAVIIREGMRRMYERNEDVFYYLTLYNENYPQPPMPDGVEEGILRGLYRLQPAAEQRAQRIQLFASGTALPAALEAQRMLLDHDVAADLWNVTSYLALRNDALAVERHNRLHPDGPRRVSYIEEQLRNAEGPVVAVSDYQKTVADQVARFVPQRFVPLGTDGYGRSDTRAALRNHFEVDARHITIAALDVLADLERIPRHVVTAALEQYEVRTEGAEPRLR
jgi:pyruvate dehydrogenase E1 component